VAMPVAGSMPTGKSIDSRRASVMPGVAGVPGAKFAKRNTSPHTDCDRWGHPSHLVAEVGCRGLDTMRILVVEDEDLVRSLLRIALEGIGYGVVEARHGLEGLAAYRRTAVDLVITDVDMPEMDGATMIKTLRGEQAHVPVIAISGVPEKFSGIQELGVQYTFKKPFDLQELLNTVQTLLREQT
jgi:CheY-like chemotaxis protein